MYIVEAIYIRTYVRIHSIVFLCIVYECLIYVNIYCLHCIHQVYKMTDNDSLASYVAVEMNADLLILLSDVNGIYSGPPSSQDSRHIAHYHPEMFDQIVIGEKSGIGRGGMRAKVRVQCCLSIEQ